MKIKDVKIFKFNEKTSLGFYYEPDIVNMPEQLPISEYEFNDNIVGIGKNFRIKGQYIIADLFLSDNYKEQSTVSVAVSAKNIDGDIIKNFKLESLSFIREHTIHELNNNVEVAKCQKKILSKKSGKREEKQ